MYLITFKHESPTFLLRNYVLFNYVKVESITVDVEMICSNLGFSMKFDY